MAEFPRETEVFDSKHPHFLSEQIAKELNARRRPLRTTESAREFRKLRREHDKHIRQLITEHLARLDRLISEPETDPIQVYVARAYLREQLAQLNGTAWTPEEVEVNKALLVQALADARASGQKAAIFSVLMDLGHLYRYADDFENAEWHYKEALGFTHRRWGETWITMVLDWLGRLYSDYEETLPSAVLMFDLASRYVPHGLHSIVEMQRCRLWLGRRDELLTDLEVGECASPRQIAEGIGAALALGRRKKRVIALAQRGITETEPGSHWRRHFEGVLERTTRPRVAPAEHSDAVLEAS